MYRFEPTPPGSGTGGAEPDNPYAQRPPQQAPRLTDPTPYPSRGSSGGPWGPVGYNHHPHGTLALVLGILAVVGFGLAGPIAWYIASRGLREAARSPYPVNNRGQLVAGQVLGIIGTAFLVLSVLLSLVWVLVVIGIVAAG